MPSISQLAVIYFENNNNQCLSNTHRANLDVDIEQMHPYYDETIAYVESMECMKHVVPLFNSDKSLTPTPIL